MRAAGAEKQEFENVPLAMLLKTHVEKMSDNTLLAMLMKKQVLTQLERKGKLPTVMGSSVRK